MRYLFLIILLFSLSCKQKDSIPENLIPKDKMIDILIDMHLADAIFTSPTVRSLFAERDSVNFYEVIFENYGYTRIDFDTSVYYYSHNINEYNKMYIEVLNRLNEMETEVKREMQEIPDTLQ